MKEDLEKIEDLFINDDNEKLRTVMDTIPVMLWYTEKKRTVYLNKGWLLFTGRTLQQELGKGWLSGVHPDDQAICVAIIPLAFHEQVPYEVKYRLLHYSGEYRWIIEQGKPVFSAEGTFKGYVGGCLDIDDQEKMEIKLSASEERYRRLFETARDGILILDSETGEITDVNPFLEQLLGYSKKEFLGKKLWDVGAFKNTKESKEAFKLLQDEGYARYDDLPLESSKGILIAVEFVSNAYTTSEGRVMQCNIRDISQRKKAEALDKELSIFKQENLKTAFISDVTHELRTPIAIIKGNVELALRDKNKKTSYEETFQGIRILGNEWFSCG